MKTLYFDCFSGAAGDMILGALIDAGLPIGELKQALGSLGVEGWDVSADSVVRTGITATKFRVHEAPRRARDASSLSSRRHQEADRAVGVVAVRKGTRQRTV